MIKVYFFMCFFVSFFSLFSYSIARNTNNSKKFIGKQVECENKLDGHTSLCLLTKNNDVIHIEYDSYSTMSNDKFKSKCLRYGQDYDNEIEIIGHFDDIDGVYELNPNFDFECRVIDKNNGDKKFIGPNFFGLQLGMPLSDAYEILKKKYNENNIKYDSGKYNSGGWDVNRGEIFVSDLDPYLDMYMVHKGEEPIKDQTVGYIGIGKEVFKVDNLLDKNVLQQIVNHYHIKNLKGINSNNEYESKDDGYKINITRDALIVRKAHKSKAKMTNNKPVFE